MEYIMRLLLRFIALAVLWLLWVGSSGFFIPNEQDVFGQTTGESYAFSSEGVTTFTTRQGESDDDIISKLPDVSTDILLDAHAVKIPVIDHSQSLQTSKETTEFLSSSPDDLVYPDTLLTYSNGFYGDSLRQAAFDLNLNISERQLQTLESVAALRGVNTRVLLTLAFLKKAPQRFTTEQDWNKWLLVESTRLRSPSVVPINDAGGFTNSTSKILQSSLNAASKAVFFVDLQDFDAVYSSVFGSPYINEMEPMQTTTPFLTRPYQVNLTGRGFFDHTYPSIDNGSQPNIAGMLNYLGERNVNYDSHDGDDFWMPHGSPVLNPVQGGQLTVLDRDSDGGLSISYPGGYEIVIWHTSTILVNNGTYNRGHNIARSGTANRVPHIHFEVRRYGKQVDTMGWYGGGTDPCLAQPNAINRYRGCGSSEWLWMDSSPPVVNQLPGIPGPVGPQNGATIGSTSATLSWTDPGDPDNSPRPSRDYFVEVWQPGGTWRLESGWRVNTSWTITTPGEGMFAWRVRSGDGLDASPWSPKWTFTVRASPPLPTNFHVTSRGQDNLTLGWTDNAINEDGYRIYRWNGSTWPLHATIGPNVNQYVDGNLICNQGYSYRLAVFNSVREWIVDGWIDGFTTACPQPPTTPTDLHVTVINPTSLTLGWRDNSDNETGFNVYKWMYQDGHWDFFIVGSPEQAMFIDTNLTCDQEYFYQVSAFNTDGESTRTDWIRIRTAACPPQAPDTLRAIATTSSAVQLSWNDRSTNEQGFNVYLWRNGTNGWDFYFLAATGPDVTSFTMSDLQCDAEYFYLITAFNDSDESERTEWVRARTQACSVAPGTPSPQPSATNLPPTSTPMNSPTAPTGTAEVGPPVNSPPISTPVTAPPATITPTPSPSLPEPTKENRVYLPLVR